jgi:hypothetical protein
VDLFAHVPPFSRNSFLPHKHLLFRLFRNFTRYNFAPNSIKKTLLRKKKFAQRKQNKQRPERLLGSFSLVSLPRLFATQKERLNFHVFSLSLRDSSSLFRLLPKRFYRLARGSTLPTVSNVHHCFAPNNLMELVREPICADRLR